MMKPRIMWITLALTVLFLSSTVQASQMVFNVESATGVVGEFVDVKIEVQNLKNVSGGQFEIVYNPQVAGIDMIRAGALLSSRDKNDQPEYYFLPNRRLSENRFSVAWLANINSETGELNTLSGAGQLVTMTFKLESAGTVDFDVEDLKLFDENGSQIPSANMLIQSGPLIVRSNNLTDDRETSETAPNGTTTPGTSSPSSGSGQNEPTGTDTSGETEDGTTSAPDSSSTTSQRNDSGSGTHPINEGESENDYGYEAGNEAADEEQTNTALIRVNGWQTPLLIILLFTGLIGGSIYYNKKIMSTNKKSI